MLPNESRLSCGRKVCGRPVRPLLLLYPPGAQTQHSLLGRARQLQALVRRRRGSADRVGRGLGASRQLEAVPRSPTVQFGEDAVMDDEIALGSEVQTRPHSRRLPFVVIVEDAISRRNRAAVALPNEVEQCGLEEALVLAAQTIEIPWGERGPSTCAPGDP